MYRYIQVAAITGKEKPNIKHQFDPWHLAKDLIAAGPLDSSFINCLVVECCYSQWEPTSLPREGEINCVPCGRRNFRGGAEEGTPLHSVDIFLETQFFGINCSV